MKLTNVITAALAITLAISPLASAQAAGDIAIINIQDIMRDSLAAKSVKKKLESKQKSFQKEMSSKELSLTKKERALSAQRDKLKPKEFEAKVKAFRDSAAKAQREVQTKKAKLDKAFAVSLAKIQSTVIGIVKTISKERGVKVVLPTSQLLYADPSLDITKEVLGKLNKKLPNVKVNF